jgi:phage baseplate assembly protein W
MTGYLSFPYQIDGSGQTATTDLPTYIQNLILLVLETNPGERVNRPDFGAGLRQLVFSGMDAGLASAAETLVRGKLLQFLGDAIAINTLSVNLGNEAVTVDLTYFVTHSQTAGASSVTVPLPGYAANPQGSGIGASASIEDY